MRIWSFPSFYPNALPGRRWNGIFAHRQNLGLVENGVEVKVIQPVKYKWPRPLNRLFPCDTELNHRNLPRRRVLDDIEIFHPIIADPRPSRLFRLDYGDQYKKAVRLFFREQGIRFGPQDFFFAQWLPEAYLVVELGREWGVTTGVMAIGDDVLVLPQASASARQYLQETLLAADIRFAVSQHLAEEACRIVEQPLSFHVVRRGVNYHTFHPGTQEEKIALRHKYNIDSDWITCLCVGTMLYAKGWLDLLDALQTLAPDFPRLRLVAVHAGQSDIRFADEVEKRGLANRVIDLGEVKPEDMPEVYRMAHLFCLPSHSEGISNAVVEAMASGLPVVTTALPGHCELITHEQNGLLVPVKQVAGLTNALRLLAENPSRCESLARHARQFIVTHWGTFSDNSRKIIDAYRHFGSRGAASPAAATHTP